MKFFNSLQVVTLFAAGPSLIQWLGTNPFESAWAVRAVVMTAYFIGFWAMVGCVWHAVDRNC